MNNISIFSNFDILNTILIFFLQNLNRIFKNLDFAYINKKIAEIQDPKRRPFERKATTEELQNYLKDNSE